MRSTLFLTACLLTLLSNLIGTTVTQAASMDQIRGRIVIQTEDHGEAWYILPTETVRFYIKNGDAAYAALRNFGLGISNDDLSQIPLGIQLPSSDDDSTLDSDVDGLPDKLEEALGTDADYSDSDNDGYTDTDELHDGYNPLGSEKLATSEALVERLKGYVLLQVESRGEAWYVNPADGKRYYMANGEWAYEIMQSLSLGITNNDLSYVPIYDGVLDCGESIDCMIGSIEAFTDFTGVVVSDISLFGRQIQTWSQLDYSTTRGDDARYPWTWTTLQQLVDGVEQTDAVGVGQHCRSTYYTDLIDVLSEAKLGNYSDDTPSTMVCESFGE